MNTIRDWFGVYTNRKLVLVSHVGELFYYWIIIHNPLAKIRIAIPSKYRLLIRIVLE